MNGNITDHPAAMLETEPNEWSTKSSHTKKSIADDATNKGKKITIYVTNECYPGPQN
jgi:hypothetical protein